MKNETKKRKNWEYEKTIGHFLSQIYNYYKMRISKFILKYSLHFLDSKNAAISNSHMSLANS